MQLRAPVPTHPRSPKIESVPRPYDMDHGTEQNMTWFSLL